MTMLKSDFLNVVKERGFFHQCTDLHILDRSLDEDKPVVAYAGFDCTGPSAHIGHLLSIMVLRWFQKCGHKPIVLMGGATTRIGDPTGRTTERPMLSDSDIAANMAGFQKIFDKYLLFGTGETHAVMVNNATWMDKLNLIEFMREYGRHFSISRMLSMDSVKLRLARDDSEMSFLEFNYMLMQAYDFVRLYEDQHCRLQIGGSDQWGNIIGGVELHRRLMAKRNTGKVNVFEPIFGLTTPLITTASGAKMGKTEGGAVWLNADMLSPFDYWQFWRNTEDGDVGRFLRLFTELPLAEIEKLEKLAGAEINEAKKILANEATALCHGKDAAQAAAETARKTFEEGGAGENLKSFFIDRAALETGIPAYELLHLVGLKESRGEARKLIEGGGARLNDEKIADPKLLVGMQHVGTQGNIKLSSGKKHHLLVKVKE